MWRLVEVIRGDRPVKPGDRDEALSAERIKHLEFIQAIVARLSANSFIIKGWTITTSSVFYAYVATKLDWRVAATSLLPVLSFWYLDSYFLRQERLFRCLYDDVRKAEMKTEPFSMDISMYRKGRSTFKVAFSRTIWPFYFIIFAIGLSLLVGILMR
ncbi:hypothetical protein AB0K40_36800 [Nonomuraea bangladeshensis]|uniref:DUF3899 domain-containing protein n=1 Tax=Nonomuraea bangladeshensis TaxID=404385 RepID=A0ABV3HF02_9ACTN